MEVGGQSHAPAALPPDKTRYQFTGRWVGKRAGVDGCGKSRPHQDSILGPSSLLRVAIPTALSRPTGHQQLWTIIHTTLTLYVSMWVPFTISVLTPKYRTIAMFYHANYQHLVLYIFRTLSVTFSSMYFCRALWLFIIPVVVTCSHHIESCGLRTVAMLLFNIRQKRSNSHINKI